jgi:hypothetical protein
VEHFITEKDEATRETDVPERLQDRLPDRGGLGDRELEEMSMFILRKCTKIDAALRSLVAEMNPNRLLEFTPIQNNAVTAARAINMWNDEAHEALGDKVVELITKTIKMISYDKCEVPYIKAYCKDELAGYDATEIIWKALKFDLQEHVEDLPEDTIFLLPAVAKKVEGRFNSYCAPRPTAATLGVSRADLVAHVEHEHRRTSAEVFQVALDNLWEVMDHDETWEKIQQKKTKVIGIVTSLFGAQVDEDENLQDKADEAQLLLPETESEYENLKGEASTAREELKALGENPETLHATAMEAFEQEQATAAAAQEEEAEMGAEKVSNVGQGQMLSTTIVHTNTSPSIVSSLFPTLSL